MLLFLVLTGFVFSFTIAVNQTGQYLFYSYLAPLYYSCLLLLAPFFYLYIKHLITEWKSLKSNVFHFIPAILFFVVSIMVFGFLNNDERVFYMTELNKGTLDYSGIYLFLHYIFIANKFVFSLQIIVYFILIRRQLRYNKELLNTLFSSKSRYQLNWLHVFSFVFLIGGLNGLIINLMPTEMVNMESNNLSVSLIAFSLFFIIIEKIGNWQESLSETIAQKDIEISSGLTEKTTSLSKLIKQIDIYLTDKEAYKNPDLDIWHLAKAVFSNRTYVSKAINSERGMSFNTYINKIRIEQLLKRLNVMESSDINLQSLISEHGFNSQSTF